MPQQYGCMVPFQVCILSVIYYVEVRDFMSSPFSGAGGGVSTGGVGGDDGGLCCIGAVIIGIVAGILWLIYQAVTILGPYVLTLFSFILLVALILGVGFGISVALFGYWKSFKQHVYDDSGTDNMTAANEVFSIIVIVCIIACCIFSGFVIYNTCSNLELTNPLYEVGFGDSIEDYNIFNVIDTIALILSSSFQGGGNAGTTPPTYYTGQNSVPVSTLTPVVTPTPSSNGYTSQNSVPVSTYTPVETPSSSGFRPMSKQEGVY